MNWTPRQNTLVLALGLGAVVGVVILGVGGRVAMRVFAGFSGESPGFSLSGSITVVFMGALSGVAGGFLLWAARRLFPHPQLRHAHNPAVIALLPPAPPRRATSHSR